MSERAPGTATGDWYVDDRCIGCAAARHVAPGLIIERGGLSVFDHQPNDEEEQRMAQLAANLCPTRSVRSESGHHKGVQVYPHKLAEDIYLCGFNSRASYGAHSYFITRPSCCL